MLPNLQTQILVEDQPVRPQDGLKGSSVAEMIKDLAS